VITMAQQHEVRPETSSYGEQRVRCSCRFVGEWRATEEQLQADAADHLAAAGATFGAGERPHVRFV
jgi:hypothetical protein